MNKSRILALLGNEAMLRFRLNIAPWVVLILLLTTAASEWYLLREIDRDVAAILQGSLPKISSTYRIRSSLSAINVEHLSVPLADLEKLDPESFQKREQEMLAAIGELRAAERAHPLNLTAEKAIEDGCEEHITLVKTLRTLRPGQEPRYAEITARLRQLVPDIDHALKKVEDQNAIFMRQSQETASQAITDTRRFTILAIALACTIAIVHLQRVNRRVIDPIERLAQAANAAGEGNYTKHVEILNDDELGHLSREFNSMLEKIHTYRRTTSDEIVRLTSIMRALMKSFPDPIFILDHDRNVERMNPAAERLCRKLGSPGRLPPGVDIDSFQEESERDTSDSAEGPQTLILRMRGDDRHYIPKLVRMSDEHGRHLGFALILDDITLLQLRDQLKGNLVSTVSHEVKTPVTSIRMVIYLLLERLVGPLNSQQEDLLETAREEVDRLLRLLQNLLDIAKYEHGSVDLHWNPCDPAALCRDAAEQISLQAGEGRRIKLSLEDNLEPVLGDADLLRHVLTNLLSNAIKYSPAESTIEVIAHRSEDNSVAFGVRNEGPGISPEHLPHLFEKFYRIPGQEKKGTGLGLAIAREIITLHGGTIGCESEPGKGCFFHFTLKASGPKADGRAMKKPSVVAGVRSA